jgi:galactose oxidase-like protein
LVVCDGHCARRRPGHGLLRAQYHRRHDPESRDLYPRQFLLPNGNVFYTGQGSGSYSANGYVFNPATGSWSISAATTRNRTYGYGAPFSVSYTSSSPIRAAVLMRPGSVTHSIDMDQRLIGLCGPSPQPACSGGTGTLNLTSPPNGKIASPGYYMLFLLDSAGVPSRAQFIQLSPYAGTPPNGAITSYTGGRNAGGESSDSNEASATSHLNVVVVGWNDSTTVVAAVTDTRGTSTTWRLDRRCRRVWPPRRSTMLRTSPRLRPMPTP